MIGHRWKVRQPSDRSYQCGCRCRACTTAHNQARRGVEPDFDNPWLVLNIPRALFDRSIPDDQLFAQLEEDDDRLATALRPLGLRPGVKAAISYQ